ncbi:MAG TPA: DNA polymerase III subunit delta' [Caulobacteraceae bacterium]
MSGPPRETFELIGGVALEAGFAEALARGRLHHAWLIAGPEGSGKATFAYRAARRLLGAAPAPEYGALGAAPDDPVSRLVASRAHPDLMVIQREADDGKPRRQIPVDEVRRLPEFFAKTPAMAPWRVAIVDTADDLNVNGANALLKTLEEPPPRGALFLLTARPAALLATLRSRCRSVRLAPCSEAETAAWLSARTGLAEAEAVRLSAMAAGAPGRALSLALGGGTAVDDAAGELLASLPDVDPGAVQALAEGFRGAEGAARFALLFERLAARVRERASARALAGEGGLDPWAESFELLHSLPRRAEAVNLDRADVFHAALASLKRAARAC